VISPRPGNANSPWLLAFLGAALLGLLVAACGGDSNSSGGASGQPSATFPMSVTDTGGKAVTFSMAPTRIISYSPGATEILFAIGAGGQVVATDSFSDYPAAAKALPKLEYLRPAPEPALALRPDLVIMAGAQEGDVEQFRAAGLTVFLLREPEDIAGVIEDVRLLGRLTGKAEGAEAVAKDMEKRVTAVQQKANGAGKGPLVFFELSPDGFSVSPNSFVGSMLKLVKAGNVADGAASAFPQLSAEVIIEADPEVILLSDAGEWGGQSLETVKARPGWSDIKAVKSGRVIEIDPNVFTRPGPRVIEALELLLKSLYPNL